VEGRLLSSVIGAKRVNELRFVDWSDVATNLGVSLTYRDRAQQVVAEILGGILAYYLARSGWTLQVLPSPQLICQNGPHMVGPISLFAHLISGDVSGDAARDWGRWCAACFALLLPIDMEASSRAPLPRIRR
jgi:hypothetical protein